jgi:hypothetical protein
MAKSRGAIGYTKMLFTAIKFHNNEVKKLAIQWIGNLGYLADIYEVAAGYRTVESVTNMSPYEILLAGIKGGNVQLCITAMERGVVIDNGKLFERIGKHGHEQLYRTFSQWAPDYTKRGPRDWGMSWMLHGAIKGGHNKLCETIMKDLPHRWWYVLFLALKYNNLQIAVLAHDKVFLEPDSFPEIPLDGLPMADSYYPVVIARHWYIKKGGNPCSFAKAVLHNAASSGNEELCREAYGWGACTLENMLTRAVAFDKPRLCHLAKEWGVNEQRYYSIIFNDADHGRLRISWPSLGSLEIIWEWLGRTGPVE